jgi:hypothetical protein
MNNSSGKDQTAKQQKMMDTKLLIGQFGQLNKLYFDEMFMMTVLL